MLNLNYYFLYISFTIVYIYCLFHTFVNKEWQDGFCKIGWILLPYTSNKKQTFNSDLFIMMMLSQQALTCLKSTMEAPEHCVNSEIQNIFKDNRTTSMTFFWCLVLVSLLLTLKRFHTLFGCFHSWLWIMPAGCGSFADRSFR